MLVGNQHGPPAARSLAAHRDVAAKADKHAAGAGRSATVGPTQRRTRRPVGAQSLGGGAKVELDPGRQPE